MDIIEIIKGEKTAFVDVRSTAEYSSGHIEGAKNIPLDQIPFRTEEIESLGSPIVFYCLSGGRSGQAVSFLKQKGFDNIYNGGGFNQVLSLKNK